MIEGVTANRPARPMNRALPLLAALPLAACITIPAAFVGPTAQLNEFAAVGNLRVKPLQIVEDSRCPANVVCVWAGRLILRAEIRGTGWRENRDLTLGEPLSTHGTSLVLTAIKLDRVAISEQKLLLYRFTFQGGL